MPKIIENKFVANKCFTDRIELQKAFFTEYNYLKNNLGEYSIIEYYGIGGIGKTALLTELVKNNYPSNNKKKWIGNYYIKYDFDSNIIDIRNILIAWRNMLVELDKSKFKFNGFDIGCLIYAEKIGDAQKMLSEFDKILDTNIFLKTFFTIAQFIPGVSTVASIIKASDDSKDIILDIAEKKKIKKIQFELEELSTSDILNKLPELFYKDLAQCMQKCKEPLVIFLDTYEKLTNGFENDLIIQDKLLINPTHGIMCKVPNILWVIFGREKLNYPWKAMHFKTLPEGKSLDQVENPGMYIESKLHLLGNLSEKDSYDFLLKACIPNSIHKKIFNITQGNPLWLNVAVTAYEDSVNADQNFDITCVETTEELVDRYLNKYMDDEMRNVIKQLAIIGKWTYESRTRILEEKNETTCEKIENACFIKKIDNLIMMHELIRNAIYKKCIKEGFKLVEKIYNNACNYYTDMLDNTEVNSLEFLQLLDCFIDIYTYINEYNYPFEKILYYVEKAIQNVNYSLTEKLLEKIQKKVNTNYGEKSKQSFICNKLKAEIFKESKKFSKAISLMKDNISYCINIYNSDNSEILDDLYDCIMKLIFTFYENRQFEDAINVWKEIGGDIQKIDNINDLTFIAKIYDAMGFKYKAIELIKNVIKLESEKQQKEPKIYFFYILLELFNLLYDNKQIAAAEKVLQDALLFLSNFIDDKTQNLEISPKEQTNITIALYKGYRKLGKFSEAGDYIDYAIKSASTIFGTMSFEALTCAGDMFDLLFDLDLTEDVFNCCVDFCNKLDDLLGENHLFSLYYKSKKAFALSKLRKNKQAIEIYEEIFNTQKEIYGEEHLDTISTMIFLISEYRIIGNLSKAYAYAKKAYDICSELYAYNHETNELLYVLFDLENENGKQFLLKKIENEYKTAKEQYGEDNLFTEMKLHAKFHLSFMMIQSDADISDQEVKIFCDADREAYNCLLKQNYKDAISIEQDLYLVLKLLFTENNELTIETLEKLIKIYAETGNYDTALFFCKKNYEICKRNFDITDFHTINQMYLLFTLYKDNKDYENAITIGEDFYKLYEKTLGENNEYITLLLPALQECYKKNLDNDSD